MIHKSTYCIWKESYARMQVNVKVFWKMEILGSDFDLKFDLT